jgi:signal transduction histidine kinase
VTAVRPEAPRVGIDDIPAPLYAVATAGEAGTSVRAVAGALLERISQAVRADRAVLVVEENDDQPRRVAAVWVADTGLIDLPARLAADDAGGRAALSDATEVRLVAHGRGVASVLFDGDIDVDLAKRLAVPAGPVLDAARRAEMAAADAERADRLASLTRDLMSIVSHELRTPLTSVIGSLQTLQRDDVDPAGPEGRKLIASALSRAERLRSLVDDLLVTARPDDPVRTRHRPIDPADLVRSAIASVPGAQALVAIEIEPQLSPVLLDGGHLERVLVNLIDNAVRHGGGPVELAVRHIDRRLVISIVDHGPGVPPTIARTVLDRRFGSPDSELRPSGPGLGLTVTRSLVEGLGGTLRHEPTPGGGATFVVDVPYRSRR